ncbi:endonuclease domain-containing 1 protein-like [Archocentrus centrarchus]|uniref:endonuclease domain-containing 1 protein-like n=1 Tax=Archocentrus centrarchus TaxID=63155 RepID=UPI0011EA2AAC|nr:endonuclease domain-containing 1 protein-like [Archocentrus centrarchus]
MVSLMMQHLLPPVALLLLSIIPTETKVVTSMAECNEFFLQQTPPNIPGILEGGNILDQNRYKPICQTLRDISRFMTLYDIRNKIPVFSAAKYGGGGEGKKSFWKVEPQLENTAEGDNMIKAEKNITYINQAGDTDYNNKEEYTRGHLFPSYYRSDEVEKRSTFTLTNVVPQKLNFNSGSWNKMEHCVKCILDNYCINNNNIIEGFVVIGAQPSNGNILNNKINIPSMLWSAFCCYSGNQNKWLAGAHWGENRDNGHTYLQTKTLAELKNILGIEAFRGTQCPNDITVTQLYLKHPCKSHCRQTEKSLTPPTSTNTPSV